MPNTHHANDFKQIAKEFDESTIISEWDALGMSAEGYELYILQNMQDILERPAWQRDVFPMLLRFDELNASETQLSYEEQEEHDYLDKTLSLLLNENAFKHFVKQERN